MSTTPCGDHTQLSSDEPDTFSYAMPFVAALLVETRHSTREKLIRHCSPSVGGPVCRARSDKTFHGNANSTVQPLSVSAGLLSVPRTWTAVFIPGISQSLRGFPSSRYGLSSRRSQVVLSALISNS